MTKILHWRKPSGTTVQCSYLVRAQPQPGTFPRHATCELVQVGDWLHLVRTEQLIESQAYEIQSSALHAD